MHQVSFDPAEMKGKIITNTSYVKKEHLDETLSVFYDAIHSGLAVSPMIEVLEEERSIKIKDRLQPYHLWRSPQAWHTGASQRWRPDRSGGARAYQVHRHAHVLATTIDPIDILTAQGLMNITGMMRTGNGRILGNLHEAPMLARDRIEGVLELLASGGSPVFLSWGSRI